MEIAKNEFQPIPQNHPMGCAVACVASLCHLNYDSALKHFENVENAWTRGFYCSEVVTALKSLGLTFHYEKFNSQLHSDRLAQVGTIGFIAPNQRYPNGHYLLRTHKGWMNPWSNFPRMNPVLSDIESELPGEISYLVYR